MHHLPSKNEHLNYKILLQFSMQRRRRRNKVKKLKILLLRTCACRGATNEKQQPTKYSHLSKISLGKNASAALQCCYYHLLKETLVGNSSPRPSFPASNFCWKRSNKKIDVSTFMYVIMKQYH